MFDKDTAPLRRSVTRLDSRIRRFLIAVATTGALLSTAFAPAAAAHAGGCRHANTPIAAASRPALQRAVVCLINRQRRERGLPALRSSRLLNRSAQGWTNGMVSHRIFSHGADFAARISAVGFHWSMAGENIATGFDTPATVVRGWMASAGHCQNILSPAFSKVGTGVSARAVSGASSRPGTWTQDFGLPMGAQPPSGNSGPAAGCPYN